MFYMPRMKKAQEVMTNNYIVIEKGENIERALQLLIKNNRRIVFALDKDGYLEGLLSMTDISNLSKLDNYTKIKIGDVMTKDIIFANENSSLVYCRDLMLENHIGVIPILDQGKLIGIINQDHIRDFLYMNVEKTENTVNSIIREIKEGICAIDTNGVVLVWNKFMEDMYDIKSKSIVGKRLEDYLDNTVCMKVLETKTNISEVYNSKHKQKYSLVSANPIYINNTLEGVVCTELDITEAKKLSSELEKANDKLMYLQSRVKDLSPSSFDNILGTSYKLNKSKDIAKQVSKTTSSIFVFGESGTGKEVFARAIHDYSERKGQFVPINCSAIPSELFESEMFGYEAGAFTGANKKGKMGIFEFAQDGTVFLDEIADLPLNMQAKLLRVLQEKEIRRIGGDKSIPINPRIISATNKDLLQLVKDNKFREDLYYRLNVVEIDLPPLRDRKEDIVILTYSFLEEICNQNNKPILKIHKNVMSILENHKWNGNIRELRNTIERLVVLCTSDIITTKEIPDYIMKNSTINSEIEHEVLDLNKAIENLEIEIIKKAMKLSNGKKSIASKILNIPRTTLYYKLDQYKGDLVSGN